MGNVRWSDSALDDLHAIGECLERTSRQYAQSLIARLYASPEVPGRTGREVPDVEVEHVREIVREGYRIVYLRIEEDVEVLAVIHRRQNLGRTLRQE